MNTKTEVKYLWSSSRTSDIFLASFFEKKCCLENTNSEYKNNETKKKKCGISVSRWHSTRITCAWDRIFLLIISFSSSFLRSRVYLKRREALRTRAACWNEENNHICQNSTLEACVHPLYTDTANFCIPKAKLQLYHEKNLT
jgi:hypothetical protein